MITASVKIFKIININLSKCVRRVRITMISQIQPKLLNNLTKHRKPQTRLIKDALIKKNKI